MHYYIEYLMSEPGDDNDVILFVDAYDIILFPHIQKIDQLIYQSKTPILFCSEAGIYVEYAGKYLVACLSFPSSFISPSFLSLFRSTCLLRTWKIQYESFEAFKEI